ncbi:MAG: TOBE domain-containing protein, partial [Actinomycetota bacterium]|nr:TOBE domain-containing protein [Actinomycetota bacterium]
SNSMQVKLTDRSGDHGVMRLAGGMRILIQCPNPVGDEFQITIRPEKIRIGGTDDDPARSWIVGTVIERIYLGSLSQVLVELPTGERLVVHELNDDFVSTGRPGDPIELSWAARHSLVVAGQPATGENP